MDKNIYNIPKRVIIETDYTCNLRCKTCILTDKEYKKIRDEDISLSFEKLKLVIDKIKPYIKYITFIGGEPFLKDYFIEIALYSKENNIKTSVVTNGTLLYDKIIDKIIEKDIFENIIFSVDGPKETHNKIRGEGVFEKVYENIKRISYLKSKQKLKKPKILIYITISKLNYKNIYETLKTLIKLNPNRIRVQLASSITDEIIKETNSVIGFDSIKTHSYKVSSIELDNNEKNFLKEQIIIIKNDFKIRIDTEKIIEGINDKCIFIEKEFIITPSGNMLICPMLNNFVIGNIYENDIKDIFRKNKDKINNLLNLSNLKKLQICKHCCVEKINY